MASVNKAILIGHVGKEPDIRTTSSGDTVASFSLATNSGYGDNKTTDWHLFSYSTDQKQHITLSD